MLCVTCFGPEAFAADGTGERSLSSVHPNVTVIRILPEKAHLTEGAGVVCLFPVSVTDVPHQSFSM